MRLQGVRKSLYPSLLPLPVGRAPQHRDSLQASGFCPPTSQEGHTQPTRRSFPKGLVEVPMNIWAEVSIPLPTRFWNLLVASKSQGEVTQTQFLESAS